MKVKFILKCFFKKETSRHIKGISHYVMNMEIKHKASKRDLQGLTLIGL